MLIEPSSTSSWQAGTTKKKKKKKKTILKSSEPYFVAGIDRGVFLDFSAGRPFRVGRVIVDVLLLDLLQQQEAVRAARLLPDLELGSAPLRGWSRMIGLKQNPI